MVKNYFLILMALIVALSAQAATNYGINVGGTEVNSDNYNNVTNSNITHGTVSYDPSTNVLTLYNVTIKRTTSNDYCVHNRNCAGLTIRCVGVCDLITVKSHTIHMDKTTTIEVTSGSTLNVKLTESEALEGCAIYSNNAAVTIKGPGTLNVSATAKANATYNPDAIGGKGENSSSTLTFSNITAKIESDFCPLYQFKTVTFNAGSDVELKSLYASAINSVASVNLEGKEEFLSPVDAFMKLRDEGYHDLYYYDDNGEVQYARYYAHISDNYGVVFNRSNFPDDAFRIYLKSLQNKGYLTKSELQNLTKLNISYKGISDMTGIEKLTYLKKLYCFYNSFKTLNLNSNTALTYLDCAPNTQLTSLLISNCTNLDTIYCYGTGISKLYVDNLSKLKRLSCYETQLTSLSVSGKPQLEFLDCSKCTHMSVLEANNNPALTKLNVTGNTFLSVLQCYDNSKLAAITGLSTCKTVHSLYAGGCALTDLSDVDSLPDLNTLTCQNNKLTTLTLRNKSKLSYVKASGNTLLTYVNLTGNRALSELLISDCPKLSELYCYDCALKSLDLSGNNALTKLYCYDNKLTTLDVKNRTQLKNLSCQRNQLTSLNVQGCSAMTDLYCGYNKLSSLDVPGCNSLQFVYCIANQLTADGMTKLISKLPSRPSSDPGLLRCLTEVIESAGYAENNVFNASHNTAARAKHWTAQRWNYGWVDIVFDLGVRGDVNGDGTVNIADINAIIGMIIDGKSTAAGDVNGDGTVNIADINAVISIIIDGPGTHGDGHEWVDLGLPSGTLWATMNVGASSPEGYGDYFAWGETTPTSVYNWSTYKWCNGSESTLTKYCNNSSYGTVDNKQELLPEDDAASVNWGSSWRMPTKEQQEELCTSCTWTSTTRNGVNGMLVTGPNGKSIFMPASGGISASSHLYLGEIGFTWSRTLSSNDPKSACTMLYGGTTALYGTSYRTSGLPVRAVRVAQ